MDAVEPYFESCRDAAFDKFLTSVASAEELFKKGTMCSNKLKISHELLHHSKKEFLGSLATWLCLCLLCAKTKV
jgi:hypothetical protein